MADFENLELVRAIAFDGGVRGGLQAHPGGEHLVYPAGSTLVVERISGTRQQRFLQGHTDTISCVAISASGRYIASGQVTHPGYKADVFVWDFETLSMVHKLTLHQGGVAGVAFSPSEKFLLTLGGPDDESLALYDLESGKALAGAPSADTSGGRAHAIAFANKDDYSFVSAGEYTIRVWSIHPHSHALNPHNCALRSLRRITNTVCVSPDDELVYCGTGSGDIIVLSLPHKVLKATGPAKSKFALGVCSLQILPDGRLLVGGGDGTLAICKAGSLAVENKAKLPSGVSSVALMAGGKRFVAGTEECTLLMGDVKDLKATEHVSAHPHAVNDIQFPRGTGELFASCSQGGIRVWHTSSARQLLRIDVPNVTCNSIAFLPDGTLILSGWDDNTIRGYLPESGKLKFEIPNAHNKGVTAVATTNDGERLVSGGGDGQIRVWQIGPQTQSLLESLKEHKGKVTDIRIRQNDMEFVSSSVDGSCIVWNLKRYARSQVLFASTMFNQVRYRPDEAQILTCGSDRKVHYWETFDASLIRELEVSVAGPLNALDISPDGRFFVTGGDDKLLKVLEYNEGEVTHIGVGHSGNITQAAIDPEQRFIVTSTQSGSIFVWKSPLPLASK